MVCNLNQKFIIAGHAEDNFIRTFRGDTLFIRRTLLILYVSLRKGTNQHLYLFRKFAESAIFPETGSPCIVRNRVSWIPKDDSLLGRSPVYFMIISSFFFLFSERQSDATKTRPFAGSLFLNRSLLLKPQMEFARFLAEFRFVRTCKFPTCMCKKALTKILIIIMAI